MEKKRYTVIDAVRGFALIEMIFYHALWDIVFIFGIDIPWFYDTVGYIWQQSICWIFIILSGFCTNLGSHNLRRSIIVLICSFIISAVTILAVPDAAVRFGVLCLIASGMLIMMPLDIFFKKFNPIIGAAVSMSIFILTKGVPDGYLGFKSYTLTAIPECIYKNDLTAYIGFPPDNFYSSDYFPVIPWIFLYISGYFIYHIFRKYDLLKYLSSVKIYPLEWLGRHSLIVYMLHQPLIYGILWLIFSIAR